MSSCKARGSSAGRDSVVCESHDGMRCVGGHYEGWRVRVVVRRGFREKRYESWPNGARF